MIQQRLTIFGSSVATFFILLTMALLFSLTTSTPTSAQFEEPTATPTDPVWLAFSAAREAIEAQEEVDLTTVRSWNFFQDDWSVPNGAHPEGASGIDSCVSTVFIVNARETFFGWTFQITDLRGNDYEARVSFDLEDVAVCDIFTQAPVASVDPEATPDPITGELPEPVAGSAATDGFALGGHVKGMFPETVQAMQQSGMSWAKIQIRHRVGMTAGEWAGRIVEIKDNGFRVFLGVVGDKSQVTTDAYIAEYSTFVAGLAQLGADAIEVWNEPNIDREWPAGQISGASYTKLLANAYNAIKSVNSSTWVISGAPAPTGFFGVAGCGDGGCNDDVFMQQMADAGASQYMDCVGLHYNEGIVPPSQFSGDPRGEYPTYYFSSMTARGYNVFGGLPICYTELGYLSGEGFSTPLPGAFGWASDTSVAEHAAWLADAASRAAQLGYVRLLIVWNVDFKNFDTDPMAGYAMIRPDGSCPACQSLGTVMSGQ
jgi:hypothetical protein